MNIGTYGTGRTRGAAVIGKPPGHGPALPALASGFLGPHQGAAMSTLT